MELVQVKILCTTITARYGTLNTDDILRTDSAYAEHLVKDCGAAEYVKATPDGADAPESDSDKKPADQIADPAVKNTRKK